MHQTFFRGGIVETPHESSVQFLFYLPNESLRISREIAALGNLPTNILVGILNAPFLPGVVGMAKEDFDLEELS